MDFEEWKRARIERVPGRCGGRPTFAGSRLQPHDVAHRPWPEVAEGWPYITHEDWEHAQRFCCEEPHWRMLSSHLDWSGETPRELTDDELDQLLALYPRL